MTLQMSSSETDLPSIWSIFMSSASCHALKALNVAGEQRSPPKTLPYCARSVDASSVVVAVEAGTALVEKYETTGRAMEAGAAAAENSVLAAAPHLLLLPTWAQRR